MRSKLILWVGFALSSGQMLCAGQQDESWKLILAQEAAAEASTPQDDENEEAAWEASCREMEDQLMGGQKGTRASKRQERKRRSKGACNQDTRRKIEIRQASLQITAEKKFAKNSEKGRKIQIGF